MSKLSAELSLESLSIDTKSSISSGSELPSGPSASSSSLLSSPQSSSPGSLSSVAALAWRPASSASWFASFSAPPNRLLKKWSNVAL